jgi:hypothetical protein
MAASGTLQHATETENVRLSGKTGSQRRTVKTTGLTPRGHQPIEWQLTITRRLPAGCRTIAKRVKLDWLGKQRVGATCQHLGGLGILWVMG